MKKLITLLIIFLVAGSMVNTARAITCAGATAIPGAPTFPYVTSLTCGTTNDITSANSTTCGSSSYKGGWEAVYVWTPTASYLDVSFAYSGQTWTGIFLYQGCPTSGGTCIANVTSSGSAKTLAYVGTNMTSGTKISLNSGVEYYIVIDTYPTPNSPCPGTMTINGTINLACSGLPTPGSTISSVNPACSGVNFVLSLQNATPGSGVTYLWETSPDGLDPWTSTTGTAATFTTSQLVATYYRCQVTCSGNTGTSTPLQVTMNTWQNCYCTSNATSTADEDIGNVTIGTINNSSTCTTTGGPGSISQEYSNYTATVAPTDLARTTSPAFSIGILTCGTSNYSNAVAIFIDFNQDGDFLDALENVYVSPTYTSGAHTETGIITIPPDAVLGNTRMRVVNVETTTPSGILPCGTYGYGETEDYLVNITEAPACPPPGNLLVTAYGHQANISWTEMGTATLWDVEFGPTPFTQTGTPTPGYEGLTSPNATLTLLTPLTGYAYYVRANCGGAKATSVWSGPKNFTTTVSCPAPTLPVATDVTGSSALLNWTVNGLETSWTIHYGAAGFVNGSGVGYDSVECTSTKPYPLTLLNSATAYDFYVRACCGVGDESLWSAKGTFTTPCTAASVPYGIIPFEGTVFPPSCWARYTGVLAAPSTLTVSTSGWLQDDWKNILTPVNKAAKINLWYTAQNYWLTTRQIDLVTAPTTVNLEFDLVLNAYGTSNHGTGTNTSKKFAVVISLDGGATWTSVNTLKLWDNIGSPNVYNTIDSVGQHEVINLGAYVGYTVMIGFYGESTLSGEGDNDLMVDNVYVGEPITCPQPTTLLTTNITQTTADLNWTATGSETKWNIKYGAPGFDPGTAGTLISGITLPLPYTLNPPLSPNTNYEWYVQADCDAKATSSWSGPGAFKTLCGTISLPWCEPFQLTTIPDCWTISGPQNWIFTNTWPDYGADLVTDHTGTGGSFAGVDGSGSVGLVGITMNSPIIDVTSLTSPMARFYVFNNNISSANLVDEQKLVVEVLNGASVIATYTWDYGVNFATWQEISVPFTKPLDNLVQLRFVVDKGTGSPFYDDMIVDDICIVEAPPCPPPINLLANPGTISADVSWTSSATVFDVEYGPAGFIPTYSASPGYEGVANPVTINGLDAATNYEYYVRANCGGDPVVLSDWAGPKAFTTLCNLASLQLCESFAVATSPVCWTYQLAGDMTANHWGIVNSALAGGAAYEAAASWSPEDGLLETDQSRMVAPAFSVSGISAVNVTFKHMLDDYAAGIVDVWVKVQYSFDGTNFTDAWSYGGGLGVDIAAETKSIIIPITGTPTKMWVAWTLAGYSYDINYWYVDDICISEALGDDVGTSAIALAGIVPPTTPVIPSATVTNYGSNPESFDVTMTISDGYISTQPVTGLPVGGSLVVNFDPWTPAIGTWTVSVCTELVGDDNTLNDCMSQPVQVKNPVKIYAYNAYDPTASVPEGPCYFYDIAPGTITSLAATTSDMFVCAGSWVNGVWYGSEYYDTDPASSTYLLGGGWWTIDPVTGLMNNVAALSRSFTGIAYDHTNNILYGVDYDDVAGANNIYTIIPSTGAATLVGTILAGELLIDLGYTGDGFLYGVGIGTDHLFKIDPSLVTAPVDLGACGFAFNYAQGMGYDYGSSTLYVAGYTTAGQLMTADLTNGACTLIGNFQGGAEIDGVAIPYSSNKILNLSYVFPEGLYAGSNTLNPAYDEYGLHFQADTADMITVELHNANPGNYADIKYAIPAAVSLTGTSTVAIPSTWGDYYYLTIKHRNSVETTSADSVDFSGATITYAFDTQAQAYGSNMGLMIDGAAVIFGGDENQDQIVDGTDLSDIGNLADFAASGYLPQDINGDGLIDGSDLSIAGNNADLAVGAILP